MSQRPLKPSNQVTRRSKLPKLLHMWTELVTPWEMRRTCLGGSTKSAYVRVVQKWGSFGVYSVSSSGSFGGRDFRHLFGNISHIVVVLIGLKGAFYVSTLQAVFVGGRTKTVSTWSQSLGLTLAQKIH